MAARLTFYRFPREHWPRLRTSNAIARAFRPVCPPGREVRRRTHVVARFPGEMDALTLIWATLQQNRLKSRGVRMDEGLRNRIVRPPKEANIRKMDLSVLDKYLEPA